MRISDWSSDVCSSDLLGRKFDSRVGGRSLDARDPTALDIAVSEVDVVICCTESGNVAVADACIRQGTGFVAIAASVSVLRELAARHDSAAKAGRSEEHTSELQSLMRISYAVFCLKKKNETPVTKQ